MDTKWCVLGHTWVPSKLSLRVFLGTFQFFVILEQILKIIRVVCIWDLLGFAKIFRGHRWLDLEVYTDFRCWRGWQACKSQAAGPLQLETRLIWASSRNGRPFPARTKVDITRRKIDAPFMASTLPLMPLLIRSPSHDLRILPNFPSKIVFENHRNCMEFMRSQWIETMHKSPLIWLTSISIPISLIFFLRSGRNRHTFGWWSSRVYFECSISQVNDKDPHSITVAVKPPLGRRCGAAKDMDLSFGTHL